MPTSGSLNYDASITNEKRSVRIYKDLNLNFNKNLVTNDVAKLTDVEAIKRSVRNLVQLNHYENHFIQRLVLMFVQHFLKTYLQLQLRY